MTLRKLFLIIILFTFITGFLAAQSYEFKHYSSIDDGDYENNYSGIALAGFIESEKKELLEGQLETVGKEIKKLSKNNLWLCWKALGECDYEEGESYLIMCAKDMDSQDGILLIVTIEDRGKSFSWLGKTVDINDLIMFMFPD